MRRLLWWLGLVDLVWTLDYDEINYRLRIVRRSPFDGFSVAGIIASRQFKLAPHGEVKTPGYVTAWRPYRDRVIKGLPFDEEKAKQK